jgi:hypothetical protein
MRRIIGMTRRRSVNLADTASECRAKAASFRTLASFVQSPEMKAKMLALAIKWDGHAEGCDVPG